MRTPISGSGVCVRSVVLAIGFGACATPPAGDVAPAGDGSASAGEYDVEITRTAFGVPHIRAADYRSLGYGLGYAYAQDNFCMLAEKILQLNGEHSRHFEPESPVRVGVGSRVSSRVSDYFHRSLDTEEIASSHRRESVEGADLTVGYAAGVNRYLRETGVDGLPEPCRGAEWVRPITDRDLYLWYTATATMAGSQRLMEAIVAAEPPGNAPGEQGRAGDPTSDVPGAAMGGIGSNAWAFGRDATVNGRGLLLGNPHWEWGTMNQFYLAHLTVPGQLDVMGGAYGGMPVVAVGFNRSVAWSHTVSTGDRSVLRELSLVPGSPTTYMVDGAPREMRSREVAIEVATEDGSLRGETRTFYTTEYGPVVVLDGLPWTDSTAYALTDLNLPNHRLTRQWLAFARARDVGEVRDSAASILGIPWVNTLAADADGGALYADYSVKAYVTDAMLERCAGSAAARRATSRGLLTLDGSTTACDLRTDPAAPQPGILPPHLLPVLERSDYVANSNNSYWLTNPEEPLTGLPRVNGRSETRLSFRAQSGLRTIEARLAGRDGLPGDRFDHEAVKALVFGHPKHPGYGNRNRAAEVMLDAVASVCEDGPTTMVPDAGEVDIAGACNVLSRWDRRHDLESVGAQVFREVRAGTLRIDDLWGTSFDPTDPLNTPRDLRVEDPTVRAGLRQALGRAVLTLAEHQIPLDRPWGEVHFHTAGDRRVPVRGGDPDVLNLMITPRATGGYGPIVHGTSYVQIVGFDEDGPVAHAVLLYGQSSDPASPYYHDQLRELWTPLEWLRMPFTPAEIEASAIGSVRLQE